MKIPVKRTWWQRALRLHHRTLPCYYCGSCGRYYQKVVLPVAGAAAVPYCSQDTTPSLSPQKPVLPLAS